MSERLIRALVSVRSRAHEARGQTAAEYVGVLLVVSVIIAAVATTQGGPRHHQRPVGPGARHRRRRDPQEVT